MTAEEELIQLRQKNTLQQERMDTQEKTLRLQQETIVLQQEQITALLQQVGALTEHVKKLQERLSKDSHNSSLPPSSDRFTRQKKSRSLRKKSGKKAGG